MKTVVSGAIEVDVQGDEFVSPQGNNPGGWFVCQVLTVPVHTNSTSRWTGHKWPWFTYGGREGHSTSSGLNAERYWSERRTLLVRPPTSSGPNASGPNADL